MIVSTRTPLLHRLAGDDVLAARAGRGDDHAFAVLVRRMQPRLLAYCTTILGSAQDADDAVQNAFIKALAGLRRGEEIAAVRPWLYRIAHNEAISLIRRSRPSSELAATVPDRAPGPAESLVAREEMRAVLHAIGELPDRSRDAFLLREVGGMRHAEVAAALGTSPGNARQAVFEARVALQDDRAGRDASCDAIREELSALERRRASRAVRGHLRSCGSCRAWSDAQGRRRRALGLAPGLAGAGGLWTWIGGLAGGGAATGGATVKLVASVAAVATIAPVGVSTLERRHDDVVAGASRTPTTAERRPPAPRSAKTAPAAGPAAVVTVPRAPAVGTSAPAAQQHDAATSAPERKPAARPERPARRHRSPEPRTEGTAPAPAQQPGEQARTWAAPAERASRQPRTRMRGAAVPSEQSQARSEDADEAPAQTTPAEPGPATTQATAPPAAPAQPVPVAPVETTTTPAPEPALEEHLPAGEAR